MHNLVATVPPIERDKGALFILANSDKALFCRIYNRKHGRRFDVAVKRVYKATSIGSINTLFPKIKKYQTALKPRKSFENTLDRASSTTSTRSGQVIHPDLICF